MGNILGKTIRLSLLVFAATTPSFAAHPYPEKYYQAKWCAAHQGQAEVVLEDQTRADCITAAHAIEFWFAAANNEGMWAGLVDDGNLLVSARGVQ